MRQNDQFCVEAAKLTASMPTRMLVTLSPCQKGIPNRLVQNPTYSYIGHNPQLTHNVHQRIVTKMADSGRHGAPLTAPPHTTVTQHVGWLLNAVAPNVGHHGSCGMTAATMVGECMI
jgi:hypothetical protein